MIRTAIIGYGRSGQFLHGPGILGNPSSYQMVAVTSQSANSLAKAEQDFGCSVYTDYQEMLGEEDLDLVVIVTRNDQHAEMACAVLSAGVSVVVTKPIGVNAEEVKEIYKLADRVGKKVYPYFPAQFGSDYVRLKEIVDSGELGEVFAIHRSMYGFATRNDWQTLSEYGGGVLLNWGVHLIDPPLQLVAGRPLRVYGSTQQLLNPGDCEDVFYAIIELEGGVRVHSEWTYSPNGREHWFIQGTKGSVKVKNNIIEIHTGQPSCPEDPTVVSDMESGHVQYRREEVGEHVFGDPVEVYSEIAGDFKGESDYRVSSEMAMCVSQIIDAVKESSDKGTVIEL